MREKTQAIDKIFTKHISNKEWISRIYFKKSQNAIIRKQSKYKMGKTYEQTLHQRRYMDGK